VGCGGGGEEVRDGILGWLEVIGRRTDRNGDCGIGRLRAIGHGSTVPDRYCSIPLEIVYAQKS
jgi:hypothetical protein